VKILVLSLIAILMLTGIVILPDVYADTTVNIVRGSGAPGCDRTNSCYSPYQATVSLGENIIWKNSDSAQHTVTAGSPNDGPSGEFDSGTMSSGTSFVYRPDTVGEIKYFCMVHPWATGLVTVQESTTNLSKRIASITNDPNKLDWTIIFVTTTNKCYVNHEKALDFYTSLTKQYLNKFNFQHEVDLSECITEDIMLEVVNRLTKTGDLTIVIPDYLMSVKDRHTTGSLGHYGFWDVKTIVSQAETFNIEDKATGWTLSHELAHFALDWKNYGNDIKREAVHEVQKQYNDCKNYDTTLTNCTFLWDTIRTPSNKWFQIMSPDYTIKIGENMKPKPTPISKDSDGDGYPDSTDSCPTQRENFNSYQDSDGCPDNPNTKDNSSIIQKIEDSRNRISTLLKELSDIQTIDINAVNPHNADSRFWKNLDSLKNEKKQIDSQRALFQDVMDDAFQRYSLKSYSESYNLFTNSEKSLKLIIDRKFSYAQNLKNLLNENRQSQEKIQSEPENYFKDYTISVKMVADRSQTPILSNYDDTMVHVCLTNEDSPHLKSEFRLYQKTTSEWKYLENKPGKFSQQDCLGFIARFSESQSYDNGEYKITFHYHNPTTEVTQTGTVYFEIKNDIKTNNNFLSDLDGDGVPDKDDKCPRIFGYEYNVGCPKSVTPKDTDGDGVYDVDDTCPNTPHGAMAKADGCEIDDPIEDRDGDGVSDHIDSCPDQAPNEDGFGCPKGDKIQNVISENDLNWIISKRIDTENLILDIKNEFKQSSESIRQSEKDFDGEVSKNHIKKAFDMRMKILKGFPDLEAKGKSIIQDIYILEYEQNEGNIHSVILSDIKWNIGDFEKDAKKMKSDMKYISQELDYAKQSFESSQPKSCFLIWCW
jgi:plastocyanin